MQIKIKPHKYWMVVVYDYFGKRLIKRIKPSHLNEFVNIPEGAKLVEIEDYNEFVNR